MSGQRPLYGNAMDRAFVSRCSEAHAAQESWIVLKLLLKGRDDFKVVSQMGAHRGSSFLMKTEFCQKQHFVGTIVLARVVTRHRSPSISLVRGTVVVDIETEIFI